MPALNKKEKDRLFWLLEEANAQNETIRRGLYGDAENKVIGALDELQSVKKEIATINRWITGHKYKTAYISGAIAASIVFLKIFWDWLWNIKSSK